MIRLIGRALYGFFNFAVKITVIAFIWSYLIVKINKIIYFIQDKWEWRGIDKNEYYIDGVEKYYKEHGKQCSKCRCWIPLETINCPVCNTSAFHKRTEKISFCEE